MRPNRKTRRVRRPLRDHSRNLSIRMTEEQYQRLQRYMGMTKLYSTAYFCRLIREDTFKGRSPDLNHALHASVNKIYSNVQQILCHKRTDKLDSRAVSQMRFLADKLCEEIYLLSSQK